MCTYVEPWAKPLKSDDSVACALEVKLRKCSHVRVHDAVHHLPSTTNRISDQSLTASRFTRTAGLTTGMRATLKCGYAPIWGVGIFLCTGDSRMRPLATSSLTMPRSFPFPRAAPPVRALAATSTSKIQ